ncbi:hypothetical protein [Sphingomonas sp. PB4P5]|uniref:hypothetical protein n=1 Tax=Parasphingomonas puruogangriensis TaxID=3096155 RepID=UPI002FC74BBD
MLDIVTPESAEARTIGTRFAPPLLRSPWANIRAGAIATPWAIVILIAVAFAARAIQFGNAVIQVDDQLYLLIGDRMLHGALPYIDIWDRKPIGLFLIYAAIRLLGGLGVTEYQIVATVFVAATAITIRQAALRVATPAGALGAGVIYILMLGMFGGDGGQSPVFYNLFVALAGLCLVRIVRRTRFGPASHLDAAAAMLLMGLAIQIKYSVVFEGAFFGCVLLHHAWRAKMSLSALAAAGLAWLVLGLGPTAAAWASYAAMGYNDAFIYANFTSIFARSSDGAGPTIGRLSGMAALLLPLAYAAFISLWPGRSNAFDQPQKLLFGWCLAAIAAVLVFGSYFDHYALPMLVPLTIGAAPVLSDRRAGLRLIAGRTDKLMPAIMVLALFATAFSIVTIDRNVRNRGRGAQARQIAAWLKPRLTDCLFVFGGETILYHLTGSCLPTRWPFPEHLDNRREDGALGVDVLAEIQRIMARRPQYVVSSDRPESKTNMRTWDYMVGALARDYRVVMRLRVGSKFRLVFERLPGH